MNTQKITWDFGLLYRGNNDPQIEKDIRTIEKAYTDFEKKYKKTDFTSSAKRLLVALEDRETLREKINGSKPWWYFALKMNLDSGDTVASAYATKLEQRITDAQNKITFFGLTLSKISKENQRKFLKDPYLAGHRYSLKRTFDSAKYKLSESEEQIINLLSQTSYGMWVDGQKKVLDEQTVMYKGEKIPFAKANKMFSDLPVKERREMHTQINEIQKSISHFAEAEINAVYSYKKVIDERRGYKTPYSSTLIGNENDEKTIELLVDLVTKNFSVSKRFYKLHARLLKENKLTYADRMAGIGEVKKKFDFNTAVSIVRDTFAKIDKKYVTILDQFIANGQIDVYSRKGKTGGAFCWGMGQLPTFVLLNHADTIDSVETLAHEMGHAIHTELSKAQPPRYQHYSTAVAEVASTFFEQAVSADLENHLSKNEQIILLHNKIRGDVTTIFRQIACFNFEKELHLKIREQGSLSRADIASLLSKHMKAYLGDAVDVTNDDGYGFVSWSHIRSFFYTYTYAYGQLISRALFERWKKDPSYTNKIEQFLSAGRSMSPEDVFKKIGIDTSDPTFFELGIKGIEADIKRLEKLSQTLS